MTRTGVLSDEHILKHCAIYNPIPMKIADKLLHQDLNVHKESPFTTKKLKYHNVISRPTSFNTLANSLTRIGGNDLRIREHLIKSFVQEINGNGSEYSNGNGSEYSNGNGSEYSNGNGGYDSNGNGTASTASDDRVNFVSPLHDNIPYEPFSMGTRRGFETPDDDSDEHEPFSPTDITASGYRRGQLDGAQQYAIRQDRISLQEEFVRRPRASMSAFFERAREVRNSVDRQSGYLGDFEEPETWPDL